jgi:NitT/TauT family transport system substrate-binding protein
MLLHHVLGPGYKGTPLKNRKRSTPPPVLSVLGVLASVFLLAAGCQNNAADSAKSGTKAEAGNGSKADARSGRTNEAGNGSKTEKNQPLLVAYSDWPGWLVWEIAAQKGFFEDAGVDVNLVWFDYSASIDAFAAGKVDAVVIVCGDSLVTGAGGKPSTAIVLTDFSDGNDMIIGKPGIGSIKDLKGKKVGLERNLVEHILLDKALTVNGLGEADVQVVDVKTNDTPQTLAANGADAVGAWYPISGQTLEQVAGSEPLFTSKDAPGLIYDALQVSRESLTARRDDWKKVVGVWFKCLDFLDAPATREEALKIMAGRIGAKPAVFAKNLKGTRLLNRSDNLKAMEKRDTLDSVYGSLKYANKFYLDRKVYKDSQDVEAYVDPTLVKEAADRK